MSSGIPKAIGRYEVDRLLGSGAMGFVFLGRDPDLDRQVAIKTIRTRDLSAEAMQMFLERFKNEARAAARLKHPSIVQVYDAGQDAEVGPYLVFEYIKGSTLKQVLRSGGPLPRERAIEIAEQVADALDAAHAVGIIHRDIKPDNLLVEEDGVVKLADFGVARIPDAALTREGQFLGTPCYAAPETLSEGRYGPHSDLFSFAAVLYELVCGKRAFPGDDAVSVAHKVLHDTPELPSEAYEGEGEIPSEVDDVVMRGLSKKPEQRYGSARDLGRAFRAALMGDDAPPESATPSGRPPTGGMRLSREDSKRPRARRSGGGLAFFAVLAGGLAIGIALVFAFTGSGTDDIEDAGVPETIVDARRPRRSRDASRPSPPDARVEPPDVGPPDAPPVIDNHRAEELAKDALEEARAAIDQGDVVRARAALDRARQYDPGNDDIAREAARLADLERQPR